MLLVVDEQRTHMLSFKSTMTVPKAHDVMLTYTKFYNKGNTTKTFASVITDTSQVLATHALGNE